MGPQVRLLEVGRRPYGEVLAFQRALHDAIVHDRAADTWIAVEHEPVVTLGRAGRETNLLLPRALLAQRGVDVVAVERGGDVTYHGPGQLVIYPIRKLARFREIVPLVDAIENSVIDMLRRFEIEAHRRSEHRGAYVGSDAICAVGLAVQRMVSLHGFAINVDPTLDYDRLITPCGTPQFGITSMSAQLGRRVAVSKVLDVLADCLEGAFTLEFVREIVPSGAPLPFPTNSVVERV